MIPKLDKKKNATLLNDLGKVINNLYNRLKRVKLGLFQTVVFSSLLTFSGSTQHLFFEECFEGVVTGAGYSVTPGAGSGQFEIYYNETLTLKRAIAFSYRYGKPAPFNFPINDLNVNWNIGNMVGNEMEEPSTAIVCFAVHAVDISDWIVVEDNFISINIPLQSGNPIIPNEGYWSVYCLFLFESALPSDVTCIRVYTANQVQYEPQQYQIAKPPASPGTDIGFALYSDRAWMHDDRSRIRINNSILGETYGPDATNPESLGGVRGHFYYKNGTLFGLDDDVPNNTVNQSDGIAVINQYLSNENLQYVELRRTISDPIGGAQPHPAFFITYKPACALHSGTMPGTHSLCSGDTLQLQALSGYEHYAWWPGTELSDSTTANPQCFATESRWYAVRMWNDDPHSLCSQTIPVYVTVNPIPEPANIAITPSTCPANTGRVVFQNPAGIAPFTYWLDGVGQGSNTFNNLPPGTYPARIVNGYGCEWEGTVTVPLITQQQANFNTFPQEGDSPLYVFFRNESTGATSYQWLIDGEPYSETFSFNYTFADTGTYVVNLIAYLTDPACADTATVTIRVNPGIRIALPNIFTPNGDGTNDRLVAELFGVSSMRWEVHNRWGNLLYSGDDSSGANSVELWDGTANGNLVPAGVYPVQVTAQGLNGKVESVQVMVTVVY